MVWRKNYSWIVLEPYGNLARMQKNIFG